MVQNTFESKYVWGQCTQLSSDGSWCHVILQVAIQSTPDEAGHFSCRRLTVVHVLVGGDVPEGICNIWWGSLPHRSPHWQPVSNLSQGELPG